MAHQTLVEALLKSFDAGLRAQDGVAKPVVLLWTDADRQWKPLLTALKVALPQLYELGQYLPNDRRGPVIWLKCVVDRSIDHLPHDAGVIPILYLGGVNRQMLRAGGDCPRELQPLVELLYRGTIWHQRNGRDWTVEAFLGSDVGLGLNISQDNHTRQALLRALPLMATEQMERMRGRRLDADDFDRLAVGDPVRDLLTWMSAPDVFEKRCDGVRWATFKDVCCRDFGFDPEADGASAAADSLLTGQGAWQQVWHRFCETPRLYSGIGSLLRETHPRDLLVDQARRPSENERMELELRDKLNEIASFPHSKACDQVLALEAQHGTRRGWVWSELGQSPYAKVLEPLARLAQVAKNPLAGSSIDAIASDYAAYGWRGDRAAIDALSYLNEGKESALAARVVHALYGPWLDESARCLQQLMSGPAAEPGKAVSGTAIEADACVVFVDGLRFDVGVLLQEKLEARGLRSHLKFRIAPIPTVTATAKPLAALARDFYAGPNKTDDFSPLIGPDRQPSTASRLRSAMAAHGVQIIDPDDPMMALGNEDGGWTETGNLDHLGHEFSDLLPRRIDSEVELIGDRVVELLESGWSKVRVVTDHGWLLLPGGLPKVDLPPSLAETKWARCASVRGGSAPEVPTYPWYWNPLVRIACPPGVGSFRASTNYAHGGVSPQECVVPELTIERGEEAFTAAIKAITWRGMRCRIAAETNAREVTAVVRLKWKSAESNITSPKGLSASGEASLVVFDDRHEGSAASVVILDPKGNVLAHEPTIVGESV